MDRSMRLEKALRQSLAGAVSSEAPARLAAALHHAVFPAGARIRPRLCLAVAFACGDEDPELSLAAACAIELLHCASLVHDDLPCFDDSPLRRGRPSVQAAFGEALAVLAGDALIVLAFETLGVGCASRPHRLARLVRLLTKASGMPHGIVAGQGWESESTIDLATYHRAKTSALFCAAATAGAVSAGADPLPWQAFGERLGDAYQAADDIRDAAGSTAALGKPAGRDRQLGRPSLVSAFGLPQALHRLGEQVMAAILAIPPCPQAPLLQAEIEREMRRLLPPRLRDLAA